MIEEVKLSERKAESDAVGSNESERNSEFAARI